MALNTQSEIDVKLETKLNALEAVVIGLGDQIQAIKFRRRLQCHAKYQYVCVTQAPYNSSQWNGERSKHTC